MKTITTLLLAVLLCGSAFAAEFPDIAYSGVPTEIKNDDRYALIGAASNTGQFTARSLMQLYAGTLGSEKHAHIMARWISQDAALVAFLSGGLRKQAEIESSKSAALTAAATALEGQSRTLALDASAQRKVAAALQLLPIANKTAGEVAVVTSKPSVASAASAETLQEIKKLALDAFSKSTISVTAVDKKKGMAPQFKLTPMELFSALGDARNKLHPHAWNAILSDEKAKAVETSLRALRADIAALPATADAKTFLARDLDPALAALDAVQKNPAGRTHAHVEALARLAAALK